MIKLRIIGEAAMSEPIDDSCKLKTCPLTVIERGVINVAPEGEAAEYALAEVRSCPRYACNHRAVRPLSHKQLRVLVA